jgi:hypothetical protein
MDIEKLKSLVLQLHEELADAKELPAELEGQVSEVVKDLANLTPGGDHGSALTKLEEYAAGFDAEHPKLASAMRQISVALGNVGI